MTFVSAPVHHIMGCVITLPVPQGTNSLFTFSIPPSLLLASLVFPPPPPSLLSLSRLSSYRFHVGLSVHSLLFRSFTPISDSQAILPEPPPPQKTITAALHSPKRPSILPFLALVFIHPSMIHISFPLHPSVVIRSLTMGCCSSTDLSRSPCSQNSSATFSAT